ncbi:MAG: 4-coumarate--CoA ligase family protein [Chloroflexota bacterium]
MIFTSSFPTIEIPDMTLTEFTLQQAEALADKPAIIDGTSGRTITYGQLSGAIKLVGSSLSQRGFKKGDVFAIYSPNVPEYAVIFHAVASIGGINTTINPLYTAEELTHQLNDAKAKYLLTIPMFLDKALEAANNSGVEEVFVFGEADGATPFATLMQSDGQLPDVDIDPAKDLVVLPYSSGTTGLSKGVMLTHQNIVANVTQTSHGNLVGESDKVIAILPFFHIYGMVVILTYALHKGATVVTMPRFDLEQFLQIMQDQEISYAPLVPPIVLALAKHPLVDKYDLSKLEMITSGAAPLSEDLAGACAQRLGCLVGQGYGLTETSPVTHIAPRNADQIKWAAAGLLISNTECKVADLNTGEALGAGQEGEIWIRGPQVMQGYLNNPEATADCIDSDGFFHTGDIGYADEEGYFYVVDRLKELIKYKGMQVAPAELEGILLSNPAIADAAVIPSPDEEAGDIPKAFVVLKGEITADEIMAFVAEQVAPHKKIRRVEIVDEIPKSASGKILRRILVAREREALGADS